MTFLVDNGYLRQVPVDPLNTNSTLDFTYQSTDYFYKYYCWPSTGTNPGVSLEYRRESDNSSVLYSREFGLGEVNGSSDSYFECGSHI